jgi:hypothetical protein
LQLNPAPVPSRPTRIGDNMSSSHHPVGQRIPALGCEIYKDHVACTAQEAPRKLFKALVSMGTKLGTAHKKMRSNAVLDGLWHLECARRSCGYLPIHYHDELKEAMGTFAT